MSVCQRTCRGPRVVFEACCNEISQILVSMIIALIDPYIIACCIIRTLLFCTIRPFFPQVLPISIILNWVNSFVCNARMYLNVIERI